MNATAGAVVLACVAAAAGCGEGADERVVTILPYLHECEGDGTTLCFNATEDGVATYVGPIEGFTFRWGATTELRILEHHLDDPPADGSSIRWELDEYLGLTEDAPGTTYTLGHALPDPLFHATAVEGLVSMNGYYGVACLPAVCDELLADGRIEVTLELTDDAFVSLRAIAFTRP